MTAESSLAACSRDIELAASMGPRLVDRGESHTNSNEPKTPMLQWGRGWLTAESSSTAIASTCSRRLQWGRGWLTAESRREPYHLEQRRKSFNGAAVG